MENFNRENSKTCEEPKEKFNFLFPETNYFATLSSEMVELIMSYLGSRGILNMVASCKQFDEVFLASGKLLEKIRFCTTVEPQKFAQIPKRMNGRNYKRMKMSQIDQPNDMLCALRGSEAPVPTFKSMKLHKSLSSLGLRTLWIDSCTITNRNFAVMMRGLQTTLKELVLENVTIKKTKKNLVVNVNSAPCLENLQIVNSAPEFLSFFSDCSKLKRFSFWVIQITSEEFQLASRRITALLSKQPNLRFLELMFSNDDYIVMDLRNESWQFELKTLNLSHAAKWIGLNDFLLKQQNIKTLGVYHSYPAGLAVPDLMKTICQMRDIKELWLNCNRSIALEDIEGLENLSVEIVVIYADLKVYGRNLKMFRNVKEIRIGSKEENESTRGVFELFDIPHSLLDKIVFNEDLPIEFNYHHFDVLSDKVVFELDVLKFLEKHSERISCLRIDY